MIENERTKNGGETDSDQAGDAPVEIGRREALKNIGALAGAAPAVAVLLTPSASRAAGCGGSPGEACNGHNAPTWGNPGSGAPGGQNSGLLGNGGRDS